MLYVLRLFCLALILSAPIGSAATAAADDKMNRAVDTTRVLLSQAHAALARNGDSRALHQAIASAFAMKLWERFLLQDRDRDFTAGQRREFRSLLTGYMANLYMNQFDRGMYSAPTVGAARKVRRDFLVASRFKRGNGRDLPVEWRIREVPGSGAQVIDIMVGGTSFLILKREEFRAIIDKSGAEGLLTYMRRNAR